MDEITTTDLLSSGAAKGASMATNMIFTVLSAAVLAVLVLFVLSVKKKAGDTYNTYIEPVSTDECKVKKLLPIGLYIENSMNILSKLPVMLAEIIGRQRNEARLMIMELKDAKYADYYFSIFVAEKNVFSLIAMIAGAALGVIMGLQGDGQTGFVVSVIGLVFGVALNFMMDSVLKNRIEERHTMLRMEFPDFVNQLVLLINAGMTVNRAWEKIINDTQKDTPLWQELRIAMISMKNGTPEAYAIEAFGRRCKIKEIMKFTSVLISNLKKGGAEMVPVLIQQSNECWEMRKGAAKELGAKAGVKMMLPMVLLLVAILLVVGYPALMTFSSM